MIESINAQCFIAINCFHTRRTKNQDPCYSLIAYISDLFLVHFLCVYCSSCILFVQVRFLCSVILFLFKFQTIFSYLLLSIELFYARMEIVRKLPLNHWESQLNFNLKSIMMEIVHSTRTSWANRIATYAVCELTIVSAGCMHFWLKFKKTQTELPSSTIMPFYLHIQCWQWLNEIKTLSCNHHMIW